MKRQHVKGVVGFSFIIIIAMVLLGVLEPGNQSTTSDQLPTLMSLPTSGQTEVASVVTVTSIEQAVSETEAVETKTPIQSPSQLPTLPRSPTQLQPNPVATVTEDQTSKPIATESGSSATKIRSTTIIREPVPNQTVIRFDSSATVLERQAYVESIGGEIVSSIDALDAVIISTPDTTDSQALPESDLIISKEPDYYVSALINNPPNDPYYDQQWALHVIGAPEAWQELPEDAPKVTVAVIDSGVCLDHPDLEGRIPDGYDFVDDDDTPQDELGHGCGVAGIIAANVDNGIGIAGVAPNAQILPVRVLDATGIGTYSDVAAGIIYAVDNGAEIINLSLGGAYPSTILEDAVNYAVDREVTIVAAAGNTGGSVLYPASYEPVIAVGSVDHNLEMSSFSSRGPEIDVLAPGRDIMTTENDGGYANMSGTSFASSYITGALVGELAVNESYRLNVSGFQFILDTQTLVAQSFPEFEWPWDEEDNNKVYWTSGPHSWSQGGNFTGKISASRGNGLDFAKSGGTSFNVTAMASGEVIKNECGFQGLGCIVAIKHDVGGSVMIYGHLMTTSGASKPINDLGTTVQQGDFIGYAGNTGGQKSIHLHIELRDGTENCDAPENNDFGAVNGDDCGDVGFAGNPIAWDGMTLVDDYYVSGYFDAGYCDTDPSDDPPTDQPCEEGGPPRNFCAPDADCDTIFNYDGSASRVYA